MFYQSDSGDIEQYLPYVYRVVNQTKGVNNSIADKDDLISVGVMGLIEAKNTYNSERGISFEKYAYGKIRFAILDELRRVGVVDFHDVIELRKMRECEEQLTREKGRVPTEKEVSQALGFNEKKVAKLNISRQLLATTTLDSLLFEESNNELISISGEQNDHLESALTKVERKEQYEALQYAVSQLTQDEQLIMQLYYVEGLSFVEICDIVGISQSRMSQIHKKALGKLRAILDEYKGGIR